MTPISSDGMTALQGAMKQAFNLKDLKLEQTIGDKGQVMVSVTGHQQIGDKLVSFQKLVVANQIDPLTGKASWEIRPDVPNMPPPNKDVPVTVADLRSLSTTGTLKAVAHFALTLSDVLLLLSKILSKQKFEETKGAAKLSELSMAMAKLSAEMGVDAAKLKVKEALLKVAGAVVSMVTAVAMAAVTVKTMASTTKQRTEFNKDARRDTGLDKAETKWKENNPGQPVPRKTMRDDQRAAANDRIKTLESRDKAHKEYNADLAAGKPADLGKAPPLPLRPSERKELQNLKDNRKLDHARSDYEKLESQNERLIGQKIETANQLTNAMRSFSDGMRGVFENMGTIMYAVDIAKLEGGQKILEAARQGMIANLIQSFMAEIREVDQTLDKIQQTAQSFLTLETECAKGHP